jgi:hypothetical protein
MKEEAYLSDKKNLAGIRSSKAEVWYFKFIIKQHVPNAQSNLHFMFNFFVADY